MSTHSAPAPKSAKAAPVFAKAQVSGKNTARKRRNRRKKAAIVKEVRAAEEEGMLRPRGAIKEMFSESTNVATLAYAVTDPQNSPNVRLGRAYGSGRTGVCSPWERTTATFNPTNNDVQAFLFRSALRASLIQYHRPVPSISVYSSVDSNFAISNTGRTFFSLPLSHTTGDAVHGDCLFPGKINRADPHYGYFLDCGATMTVGTAGVPVGVYLVTFCQWEDNKWSDYDTAALPAAGSVTTTNTDATPKYIAACISRVVPGSGTAVIVPVTVETTYTDANQTVAGTLNWSHRALPNFLNQVPSIEDVRVIGASLMFSNTSNMLARQGQIVGVQLKPFTDWTEFIGFNAISGLRTSTQKLAEKGMYGFLKPSDPSDFNWTGEIEVVGTSRSPVNAGSTFEGLDDAFFNILPSSGYISIVASMDPAVQRTGYWTSAYKLEYLSDDQWRSLEHPSIQGAEVELALAAISEAPMFYENPFHFQDILDWVKGVAKRVADGVIEYGPKVINAIGTVVKGATLLAPLLV